LAGFFNPFQLIDNLTGIPEKAALPVRPDFENE
jgi:hypothetical protein